MNRFLKIRIKEEDIKKIREKIMKENNCEKLLGLLNLKLIEI